MSTSLSLTSTMVTATAMAMDPVVTAMVTDTVLMGTASAALPRLLTPKELDHKPVGKALRQRRSLINPTPKQLATINCAKL